MTSKIEILSQISFYPLISGNSPEITLCIYWRIHLWCRVISGNSPAPAGNFKIYLVMRNLLKCPQRDSNPGKKCTAFQVIRSVAWATPAAIVSMCCIKIVAWTWGNSRNEIFKKWQKRGETRKWLVETIFINISIAKIPEMFCNKSKATLNKSCWDSPWVIFKKYLKGAKGQNKG